MQVSFPLSLALSIGTVGVLCVSPKLSTSMYQAVMFRLLHLFKISWPKIAFILNT